MSNHQIRFVPMATKQHEVAHFRVSLKIQIAVFGSLVFFVATLLLAKHFADELQDDFTTLLYKQQLAATEYIAGNIGNAIAVRSDSLLLIAKAIRPEWVAKPRRLREYLEGQQAIYRLLPAGLFVASPEGTILVDHPKISGRQGRSIAYRDYFIAAVRTGELALGKPFSTPMTTRAVVTWGVPIKDEHRRVVAVLGASALIHQSDLFPEVVPRDSRALGDIHVISPKDGIVVVSTNRKLSLASTDDAELKVFYERFKDGWEGSDVLADGKGTEHLVSGKRVPQTGWMVISTLPASIAFASISDNIKVIYRDAAIAALLVALLSWLVSRRLLNPLSATARAINEITSGEVPLHPLSEFGGEEIRRLIRSFNRLQKRIGEQETQLRASEERWKFAVAGSNDGVWDRDLVTGKVSYSKRYKEMYGFAEDELQDEDESWYARIHPDDVAEVRASRKAYFAGDSDIYVNERRMQCKDGRWKWALVRGMVVRRAEDGKPLRMIGTHTDISEQKRLEAELRKLATSDPLTGLPNRRDFLSRMDDELARLRRLDAQDVSVLMLDIDHFKRVNDTHGHSTGDAVLKHFAATLKGELRQIDSVGRMGGEEFAVILPGADPAAAEIFAERLRHKVEMSPLQTDALSVPVTVSIGIATMRPTDTATSNALARADEALYLAKSSGRNCVKVSSA